MPAVSCGGTGFLETCMSIHKCSIHITPNTTHNESTERHTDCRLRHTDHCSLTLVRDGRQGTDPMFRSSIMNGTLDDRVHENVERKRSTKAAIGHSLHTPCHTHSRELR